jgi:uncharacterized protein (TIGR03083 family)
VVTPTPGQPPRDWPADHPDDIAALFRLERDRLIALLAGLTVDDWRQQTPCPGWTVLGLATHLVGDDVSWLANQRDDHHGTVPPPLDEAGFIGWLDELQKEWVHAARRLSPRLVIDLLSWTGPQICDVLAGQAADEVSASVSWADAELVPVWLDQLREISERWIHRQQLLEALGRSSDLRADLAGPIIDALRWAFRYRLGNVITAAGDTVVVSVHGPVSRRWYLVTGPGGWNFQPQPEGRVLASMALTTDSAWRLLTNNLSGGQQCAITESGSPAVLHVLRRTRAIIGTPQ